MRKRYIIVATALVTLGLGTTACSNSNDDQTTSKRADKLDKMMDKAGKEGEKKSNTQSSSKFVGDTFKTSKGSVKIERLTKMTPESAASDGNVHYIVIGASFTNKAKKGVTPEDFFMDNLEVRQKLSKSTHEVGGEYSQFEDDLTPWEDKINTKLDKANPGQTIQFTMSFQLDTDDGDGDVSTYLLQPQNSGTMDSYGRPLDLKVSATQTIIVPKDNNSDTDDDYQMKQEKTRKALVVLHGPIITPTNLICNAYMLNEKLNW